MTKRNPDLVSASEIASYAFCPEAWRLKELGFESSNEAALKRGEMTHRETATVERHSTAALRFGLLLVALGVLALVLTLVVMGR